MRISDGYKNSLKDIQDLKDLFSLATQEKNQEIVDDCISKINLIHEKIKKVENTMFSIRENDDLNIYLKYMLERVELKVKTGQTC